jgi:hypothetical protein
MRRDRYSALAKKLQPHQKPVRVVTTIIGGGGGGDHVHGFEDLDGELSPSQAPWAVTQAEFSPHHILTKHSYSGGAALDVFGLSAPSTLAKLTPSSAPGAAESLLKSSAAGDLTLPTFTASTHVRTPLINTGSGDLTLSPADSFIRLGTGKGIQNTGVFATGFTGSGLRIDDGITKAGKTYIEADNLTIRGTMRVYELLIQQIRMTNGGLLVSSTGKVKAVSGSGPYTITTDGKHGFAVNDLILAQRWNPTEGALTGTYIYRSGMQVTSITATGDDWQFVATLLEDDPPVEGAEYGRIGNTTDTDRQGGIYLTSDDVLAPYIDIFNDVNSFAAWSGAAKLKARLGRLDGISDAALNPAGYGLYSSNVFLKGALVAGGGTFVANASGASIQAFNATPASWTDWGKALTFTTTPAAPTLTTTTGQIWGERRSDTSPTFNLLGIGSRAGASYSIADAYVQITAQDDDTAFVSAGITLRASPTNGNRVTITSQTAAGASADIWMLGTTNTRHIQPLIATNTYDIGKADARYRTVYAQQVIVDTISGATLSGAEWEYAGSMVIDANSASTTTVSIVNQGAGVANLTVDGSITSGGTAVSLAGHTHDDRYFTESESDARYVQTATLGNYVLKAGDTMSGDLRVNAAIGVNTAPSYPLHVQKAFGALGAATTGILNYLLVTGSGDAAGNSGLRSLYFTSQVTGTNNMAENSAIVGDIYNSLTSGTLTAHQGMSLNLRISSGGNSTSAFGYRVIPILSSTGSITNYYAVDVRSPSLTSTGTIGSAHGVWIAAQKVTGVTNGWGIYQNGATDKNYFAGVILAPAGTAGAPAIAQLTDTDTGILWPSADTIAISTGGTQRIALSTSSLESTVRISAAADSDTNNVLGRGVIGYAAGSDTATLAHYDHSTSTNRGFSQNASGATVLNAPTGQTVGLAINGTAVMTVGTDIATTTRINAAPDTDNNFFFGRAAIGQPVVNDSFSLAHYDNLTSTNNLAHQYSTGESRLNAANAQTLSLCIAGTPQWIINSDRMLPRGDSLVDVGDYNRKLRLLWLTELHAQTLVAEDVISTIGGNIIVTPTTKLIAAIDAATGAPGVSTLYTNTIAYWSLEENNAPREDSRGANDLSGSSVANTTGKQGNAAVFTGSNSCAASDNAALSTGNVTWYFATWIYPTNDDGNLQCIAAKGTPSGDRSWALRIAWQTDNRLYLDVWNTGQTQTTFVGASTFGALSVNTWYFVECWHDATNDLIGVAVNRTENTTSFTHGTADDNQPFTLGQFDSAQGYIGRVDEAIFVKGYKPDTTDRDWLYNSGTGRTFTNLYQYGASAINFDVEHNNLRNGEYAIMKTAPGGIQQFERFQMTSGASSITGGYRYTATRDMDMTGTNSWTVGDAVASEQKNAGEGFLWLTSTATEYSHTGPGIIGYVRTGTGQADIKPVFVKGNLRSFVDYASDEYGDAAGNDLTLTPTSGFQGYTIDRTNGLRLFNADIKMYNAGEQTVNISNTGTDVWFGPDSSTKLLEFDGATLALTNTNISLLDGATPRSEFLYTSGINLRADSAFDDERQQVTWYRDLTSKTTAPAGSVFTYTNANGNIMRLMASSNSTTPGARVEIYAQGAETTPYIEVYEATDETGHIDLSADVIFVGGTLGQIWLDMSFNTGWGNYSGAFVSGQYKKAGDLVFLRGFVVRTSGSSANIATLPSGYRPAKTEVIAITSNNAAGVLTINTSGVLTLDIGSPTVWVSLSSIVFSTL